MWWVEICASKDFELFKSGERLSSWINQTDDGVSWILMNFSSYSSKSEKKIKFLSLIEKEKKCKPEENLQSPSVDVK